MAEILIAEDIAGFLGDVSPSLGEVGTDIFRGPVRPFSKSGATTLIPRDCIFVIENTGGDAPIPAAGSAYQEIRSVALQIIVRNTSSSSTKAQEVYNVLADLTTADITQPGYIVFEMSQSNPLFLPGLDNNVDSYWSINMEAIYDQTEVAFSAIYGTAVYGTGVY